MIMKRVSYANCEIDNVISLLKLLKEERQSDVIIDWQKNICVYKSEFIYVTKITRERKRGSSCIHKNKIVSAGFIVVH